MELLKRGGGQLRRRPTWRRAFADFDEVPWRSTLLSCSRAVRDRLASKDCDMNYPRRRRFDPARLHCPGGPRAPMRLYSSFRRSHSVIFKCSFHGTLSPHSHSMEDHVPGSGCYGASGEGVASFAVQTTIRRRRVSGNRVDPMIPCVLQQRRLICMRDGDERAGALFPMSTLKDGLRQGTPFGRCATW